MGHILSFIDFINEKFKTVKFNGSSTGRTKLIHRVLDEPTDSKSYSSGVLLRDYLRGQELSDLLSTDMFNTLSPKQKGRIKAMKSVNKIKQSLNNLKFLQEREKELGKLICEYCGKGPLIIYAFDPTRPRKGFAKFNSSNGATCDHKTPLSKGGDPFDFNNLAVSCFSCNQKKGDMNWDDWKNRLKSKNIS